MTIRTKRRGRRSLAAILAAMLMASVLAVVAGTPAQAANTANELLERTDNEFYLRNFDDGLLENRQYAPDMAREFAGKNRYNTSVALAERYAREAGSINTVIVASGVSEVDAIAAAGLAGYLNAPVLLTMRDRLPHNVARFIDRHNVANAIVAGGEMAVSDDVMDAIEALGSGTQANRVAGMNRYETAAKMAAELGGPIPTWCNSELKAAILVNGTDAGLADAVVIGPLAYAQSVPLLLTTSEGLHDATADYLAKADVEHVIIVGGESAVPEAIVDELIDDVGVATTRRIAGTNAAHTSVRVAEEMLDKNRCGKRLLTDTELVALVNRNSLADGITAGPVMGQGLTFTVTPPFTITTGDQITILGGQNDRGPVPILLVDDTLSTEVRDYLAATNTGRGFGQERTHLRLVAVGGSAAVSPQVMTDAVAAANTAPNNITAEIHSAKNIRIRAVDTNGGPSS